MTAIDIINLCVNWFGFGFWTAELIKSYRLGKETKEQLDEAQRTYERNYTLIQFSMDLDKCKDADDIIDLQQRWHDRLTEVGTCFSNKCNYSNN